jgi:Transposase DDE domain
MVQATEANLAQGDAPKRSAPMPLTPATGACRTSPTPSDADVLITPMPATNGIVDPDDPRIAARDAVLARHELGELTLKAAALEMGVSETWARQLRDRRRGGEPDPARLRKQMLDRLATPSGKARYAKRKITAESVFGNIKANLRLRRFARGGLAATTSLWRFICAVHNLLKLRNVHLAG